MVTAFKFLGVAVAGLAMLLGIGMALISPDQLVNLIGVAVMVVTASLLANILKH